jgi:hypothetical protein
VKHHRQVLRDRVIDTLRAAQIPGVFGQVGGRPFFQLPATPWVSVSDAGERVEVVAGEYERELTLLVQVAVAVEDGADDVADSICAYIEAGLDHKLGGKAQDGWLSAVQVDASGEGDQQLLVKTLVFVFKYVTQFYNPSVSTH